MKIVYLFHLDLNLVWCGGIKKIHSTFQHYTKKKIKKTKIFFTTPLHTKIEIVVQMVCEDFFSW